MMLRVYAAYQEACDRAGLVDFAEILLRSYEVLKTTQPCFVIISSASHTC